jgi:hypothetical protein
VHVRDQQVLHDGHLAEWPRNLVRAADTAPRPHLGARAGHVLAEQLDPALSRDRAGQQADERALARAVRADHAEHLAAVQLNVDTVDSTHAAVDLANPGGSHQRRPRSGCGCLHHSGCLRRSRCLRHRRCLRRGQRGRGPAISRRAPLGLAEPAPTGLGELARGPPQSAGGQPDDKDEQDAENRQVNFGVVREAHGEPDRDG